MKDVVTLLGTVIQHLERQSKPPPPKIATRDELYPELQTAADRSVELQQSKPAHRRGLTERGACTSRGSAHTSHAVLLARALWQKEPAMMPAPPPLWGYITEAITGSRGINWRPGAGLRPCLQQGWW